MTTKEQLHHMVDEIDDEAVDELLEYGAWLGRETDVIDGAMLSEARAGSRRDPVRRVHLVGGPPPQARLVSYRLDLSKRAERYFDPLPMDAQRRIVAR
ncbi:MAG: hypothetical protein HYX52_00165 [Chloroflexi bacterium]|nr:hypothetical protein [Chloroflexota bacterium]